MTFTPQKAMKGRALANFLATHLIPETFKMYEDILDEVVEANTTLSDKV